MYRLLLALLITSFLGIQSSFAARQEFRLRLQTEPPSLDWNLASDYVSMSVLYHLMEGLAEYDANQKAVPGLASWKVSKDGKTYTYKIKPGVKWSDGVPVTAQHFWDSWERTLNPKTAANYAYFLFDVAGAQEYNEGKLKDSSKIGMRVIDESTFVVTLNKRAAYFANIPAFPVTFPIRNDIIEKFGRAWTEAKNMVVNGPFKMQEWKHDAKIEMVRNENYHGAKPKLEKIAAYIISDDSAAINMFESGALDYVSKLPVLDIDRLRRLSGYRSLPYLRGYYYAFNVSKPPFDDVRVRKAFALAINRKEITALLKGGQTPITSWIPKGLLAHNPKIGLTFDPQKAKELLAKAGYPNGKGFPEVAFMFDTRDDNKLIAQRLQKQWKQVLGVNLRSQNEEWKVYLGRLKSDPPALFRQGWGADFPDPDNFMNLFTSYSGNNYTKWKNQAFDSLIEAAASESKAIKRKSLYDRAQRILTEDQVAIIPIYQDAINILVSPRVKGLQLQSLGLLKLNKVQME